jgi:ATP-dependent DNA helicase HFM1/MER3
MVDFYFFIMLTIEQLLKKQASGNKILSATRELPQYFVTIHELAVERNTVASGKAVDVEVDIHCSVTLGSASSSKSKGQKSRHDHDMTYILTVTSDLDFVDFRRIPLSDPQDMDHSFSTYKTPCSTKALQEPKSFSVTARLTKPSQSILVSMSSVSLICPVHIVNYNECRTPLLA